MIEKMSDGQFFVFCIWLSAVWHISWRIIYRKARAALERKP